MAEVPAVWEDGSAVDAPQFYSENMFGSRLNEQDAKLIVSFFPRVLRDNFKSKEAGRPIHYTVDFIQIVVPGDRLRVVEREASDYDKERFAAKWAMYKAGKQEEVKGTLLTTWGVMSPNIAADYSAMGVKTVEQLADADELLITNLGMGGRDWKTRAQAYLAATGQSTTLLEEIVALKARLAMVEKETTPTPSAVEEKPPTALEKQQAAQLAAVGKTPPFAVTK
jgi:hypothetical protein